MKLRLAILDLYDGTANQGMRCIQEIVDRFSEQMDWKVFDVRAKNEVPDLDFDIYISSGGPGSPLDGNGIWDSKWFDLVQSIWDWNNEGNYPKKYMFFICHSFQMACHHFNLGSIVPRRSMSFGTFPIHQTNAGILDPIFKGLANPFWAADFRNWQFIEPDAAQLEAMGAEILALEKIRPHVPLERAVMSVRFSDEMVGVQFHPEADSEGMILHFKDEERKKFIMEKYGEQKYKLMIRDLADPMKIKRTNTTILPNFLSSAIAALSAQNTLAYV
jgi:GMP synthase-like glutamine amidotransferase